MTFTRPHCPECHAVMERKDKLFHCAQCHSDYSEEISCDVCGGSLERLKACGAVDYFCNHCNTLKSKSKVLRSYLLVDH